MRISQPVGASVPTGVTCTTTSNSPGSPTGTSRCRTRSTPAFADNRIVLMASLRQDDQESVSYTHLTLPTN